MTEGSSKLTSDHGLDLMTMGQRLRHLRRSPRPDPGRAGRPGGPRAVRALAAGKRPPRAEALGAGGPGHRAVGAGGGAAAAAGAQPPGAAGDHPGGRCSATPPTPSSACRTCKVGTAGAHRRAGAPGEAGRGAARAARQAGGHAGGGARRQRRAARGHARARELLRGDRAGRRRCAASGGLRGRCAVAGHAAVRGQPPRILRPVRAGPAQFRPVPDRPPQPPDLRQAGAGRARTRRARSCCRRSGTSCSGTRSRATSPTSCASGSRATTSPPPC